MGPWVASPPGLCSLAQGWASGSLGSVTTPVVMEGPLPCVHSLPQGLECFSDPLLGVPSLSVGRCRFSAFGSSLIWGAVGEL
jgi:hypothetical protein